MADTHFMSLNIKVVQGAGIYPPDTTSKIKRVLLWTYNLTHIGYTSIFFTIAQLAALRHTASNVPDLVQNVNLSASFLTTFYKVLVWWHHRAELTTIMETLQRTTRFAADFASEAIVAADRRVAHRVTYTFLSVAFVVSTSACLIPLVDAFAGDEENLQRVKLAYPSWVPFDYRASKQAFAWAVAYQSVGIFGCGVMTVGIDTLFFSLVLFTSTHFRLLCGAFATINERALAQTGHGREPQEKIYDELRSCIRHLQVIVGICDRLEAIFNVLILVQTLVSLVVFCTCLFIVSEIEIGSNMPVNEICYMLAVSIQFSLYCVGGHQLTNRAGEITDALYSSDWISVPSSNYRKNIILTMMRMNKPIVLTAGKFAVTSLALLITIGRGSYSLFAFLENSR